MSIPLAPVALIIFDGFGYTKNCFGNAVEHAHMDFFNKLMQNYPSAYLAAAGEAVGLLPNLIGNSEVGHLTLGAGRVVKSSIVRMNDLIKSPQFFEHQAASLFRDFAQTGRTLHVLGLLSDGGVHSHDFHMHALIELAVYCGIKNIVVHPILDGRDVAPASANFYLSRLEQKLHTLCAGKIGSIQGRFYAMDRDNNHDRIHQSYSMLCGKGKNSSRDWRLALADAYAEGDFDEFVKPELFGIENALCDRDGIVFVNIRSDRALQLTKCLLGLSSQEAGVDFHFVLTGYRYHQSFKNPVILEPQLIQQTLLDVVGEVQSRRPIFLLAETEKSAHVTYFFKGMRDEISHQEKRIIIPSHKVRDYVAHPQMSAHEITGQLQSVLLSNPSAFCVVNYANADMVGHSGNFAAAIKACRVLDAQLKRVYELIVERMSGILFMTSDHGNAEEMIDSKGLEKTSHTMNPVPFIMVAKDLQSVACKTKYLADTHGISVVAPTILASMGIEPPQVMTKPLFFDSGQ